jgi:small subunit ribosomal protein S17e
VDRITSLAMHVLERHKEKFTTDFAENKKLLGQLAIIRSKGLKNEMAGYITKYIKRETNSKALKEELAEEEQEVEQVETQEEQEAAQEESIPQEIVVENASEESA